MSPNDPMKSGVNDMQQCSAIELSLPKGPLIRTYFPKPSLPPEKSYAARFFNGVDEVKKRLVTAIAKSLRAKKVSPESLSRECAVTNPSLPEILANPALLTTTAFTSVSFNLGLKLDKILVPKISPTKRKEILEEMRKGRFGVKATAGGRRKLPSPSHQVNVFVAVSAFREIDLTT